VGRIAAGEKRPQLDDVDRIALEIAGFKASEKGFSQADLDRALDPRSNVALRANTGGPAPKETERMIKEREKRIARAEERLAQRQERSRRALAELKNRSRS
jgi:argininosuccinate lyase